MVTTDSIQGIIDRHGVTWWFHYDVASDVLYLRLASERDAETMGEETPEGMVLLRRSTDDLPVGLTVVDWWKRFGAGALPDSIRELERTIEPWAGRVAA